MWNCELGRSDCLRRNGTKYLFADQNDFTMSQRRFARFLWGACIHLSTKTLIYAMHFYDFRFANTFDSKFEVANTKMMAIDHTIFNIPREKILAYFKNFSIDCKIGAETAEVCLSRPCLILPRARIRLKAVLSSKCCRLDRSIYVFEMHTSKSSISERENRSVLFIAAALITTG